MADAKRPRSWSGGKRGRRKRKRMRKRMRKTGKD
jgi:hypothetical protein